MEDPIIEKLDDISKKLDLLIIVSLAKSGIKQQEIAKIVGMSTKTIVKIFGKNYEKIQEKGNEWGYFTINRPKAFCYNQIISGKFSLKKKIKWCFWN